MPQYDNLFSPNVLARYLISYIALPSAIPRGRPSTTTDAEGIWEMNAKPPQSIIGPGKANRTLTSSPMANLNSSGHLSYCAWKSSGVCTPRDGSNGEGVGVGRAVGALIGSGVGGGGWPPGIDEAIS